MALHGPVEAGEACPLPAAGNVSAESFLGAILANVGIGITLLSPQFEVLFLNAQMRNWFPRVDPGVRPVCYRAFHDPPRDSICPWCPCIRSLGDGWVHEEIVATATRAGPRKARIIASPVHDEAGEIVAVVELVEDLTTQEQFRTELHAQINFLNTLIETIPSPIFYKDAAGVYTGCNKAFAEMLGQTREEIIGKTFELAPVELAARDHEKDRELFTSGGAQSYESKVRAGDGDPREVIMNKAALHDEAGRVSGLIGVISDITGIKESERRLKAATDEAEAANRAKSEFLANVSHELRTPLHTLMVVNELLRDDPLTDEQLELLQTAKQAGASLRALIDDLLDVSRIATGRYTLHPAVFSLRRLMRELSELCTVEARAKSLHFELPKEDALPDLLWGDAPRLRQILASLLNNAIKFTPPGGSVVLHHRATPAADGGVRLRFSVKDSGVGIPREKQAVIFNPFYQIDGSAARYFGGAGLGLAIAAEVVHRFGGRLRVRSSPGSGACFWFTVRLQPAAAVERRMPRTVRREGTPLRVLLVEDNTINQRIAERMLRDAGYQVTVAGNGAEAVELYCHGRYDVILMDIQMPGLSGDQAAARIREYEERSGGRAPIIALTAHAMPGDRERFLAYGMDGYVAKPFTKEDLEEAIAAVT